MLVRQIYFGIIVTMFTLGCRTKNSGDNSLQGISSKSRPVRIISDIDDTIRITNVQSKTDSIINAVYGAEVFGGMDVLYQKILKKNLGSPNLNVHHQMKFVSGSPPGLKNKIESTLFELNQFPRGDILLRPNWPLPSVQSFKEKTFEELGQIDDSSMIMIGDDTEADPKAIDNFSHSAAGKSKVVARYIRAIRNLPLPMGHIPFFTAFDIASREFLAGRISEADAIEVGNAVLLSGSMDFESLIPSYAFCPIRLNKAGISAANKDLLSIETKLHNSLVRHCLSKANLK